MLQQVRTMAGAQPSANPCTIGAGFFLVLLDHAWLALFLFQFLGTVPKVFSKFQANNLSLGYIIALM